MLSTSLKLISDGISASKRTSIGLPSCSSMKFIKKGLFAEYTMRSFTLEVEGHVYRKPWSE